MSRLVKYEGVEQTIDLKKDEEKWGPSIIGDSDFFGRLEGLLFSNTLEIGAGASVGRYDLDAEVEMDEYDGDTLEIKGGARRYFNRFFSVGPGVVLEDEKAYGAIVLDYVFPGHLEMETYIMHDGSALFELGRAIPVTGRFVLEPEAEFHYDDEVHWFIGLNMFYNINGRFGLGGNLRKDKERGGSAGGGIRVKF